MRAFLAAAFALATLHIAAASARAQTTIRAEHDHDAYRIELEPHLDLGLIHDGFGLVGHDAQVGTTDFGGGFRATILIVDPGFIPRLNNTVGITFGVDLTDCPGCDGSNAHFYLPVGLQWNFYIFRELSVFGEPGLMLRVGGDQHTVYPDFLAEAGIRYHFDRKLSVTARVGYPFISVGLSIFIDR